MKALVIDIGNTNISAGIFASGRLLARMKFATHSYRLHAGSLKRLLKDSGIDKRDVGRVVVSSVVPLALARLAVSLKRVFGSSIRIIGRDIKVPIKNLYRIKSEVGQDRLVNAYAAKVLYGVPCVIMDLGTAITFDIVSRRGEYMGGLILPGIEMSLSTLYRNTALLPRVELKAASSIIGKDTVGSIRGGILFGFGTMCDGLISKYRKIVGKDLIVIATGGNARLIRRYAKSVDVVDEDLTLKGLYLISKNF